MWFELFLASLVIAVGSIVFGHFEERTPKWRRLLKLGMLLGVTAALAATAGRPWALGFVFGLTALGSGIHFWWCHKHGIHPLSAQPRDKYYALRGWK